MSAREGSFLLRSFLLVGVLILGLSVCWYIASRLANPVTLVSTPTDEAALSGQRLKLSSTNLKVGFYNVAHGRGSRYGAPNWGGGSAEEKAGRMKDVAQFLETKNLDVVVLNEVDFESFWSGHVNHARLIASEAGYPYIVEQRNVNAAVPFLSLGFGNAILSRYPIRESHFVDFPSTSIWKDIFVGGMKDGVAATIELPDKNEILVVGVHLALDGEGIRVASIKRVLSLQRRLAIPAIIMGDFNAAPEGLRQHSKSSVGENSVEMLRGHPDFIGYDFHSTGFEGMYTFPSEKPDRLIDWIFTSLGWVIEDLQVTPLDLSDHLPVTARVRRVSPDAPPHQ